GLGLEGPRRLFAQTVPNADRFLGKPVTPDLVDSYLAVHADGTVTLFTGKVDIGTGGGGPPRRRAGEGARITPAPTRLAGGGRARSSISPSTASPWPRGTRRSRPTRAPPQVATPLPAVVPRSATPRPPRARPSSPAPPRASTSPRLTSKW